MDGGADLILIETIFDTLNSKAAFFAIAKLFDDRKITLPLMASVTFIQPGSNRGVTGQTEAVRLGLARALQLLNSDWTSALRKQGLLTRDARAKERKKPGLKKARKAPTYTKR